MNPSPSTASPTTTRHSLRSGGQMLMKGKTEFNTGLRDFKIDTVPEEDRPDSGGRTRPDLVGFPSKAALGRERPKMLPKTASLFISYATRGKPSVQWMQRMEKGKSFLRLAKERKSIVLSTPSSTSAPWEATLRPGEYQLTDLVDFPDVEPPLPRYAKFRMNRSEWKAASLAEQERGIPGSLELEQKMLNEHPIPVETATENLLEFYGCHLIGKHSSGQVTLYDEHVIQDFTYRQDYFNTYVKTVGAGLEKHEFAHVDCPLSPLDDSGFFLLGKWGFEEDQEYLYLTAFRVPQLHALYVPGGVIHSNDYLRGTWRTMLSWTSENPIDRVIIQKKEQDRSTSKGFLNFSVDC